MIRQRDRFTLQIIAGIIGAMAGDVYSLALGALVERRFLLFKITTIYGLSYPGSIVFNILPYHIAT